jgi:hypothetical protein
MPRSPKAETTGLPPTPPSHGPNHDSQIVAPGRSPNRVIGVDGTELEVPSGWELLPPGDAGLTRRVKASTTTWTVQVKKGRKIFSLGVWASGSVIAKRRAELESERATETYKNRRASDTARRNRKQDEYVEDFGEAVFRFLDFAPRYHSIAKKLAAAVTAHATPVGSGTVARTQRIPIEQRVESAVIAWMRHQTTAYDQMKIPRVRGERREVRRSLAQQSRILLDAYRRGIATVAADCPVQSALGKIPDLVDDPPS